MAEIIDLPDAYGQCWRVAPIDCVSTAFYQLQCAQARPRREECTWIHAGLYPTVLEAVCAVSEVGPRSIKAARQKAGMNYG